MKKILTLVLCLSMVLTMVAIFASCGEADYKLGMGVVVNMDSSKTGLAQVDATAAAVVTDADGKIVMCRIDVAQNKFDLTKDFAAEVAKTFKTKMELGDDYNMAKFGTPNVEGGTVKEWYVQTKAFEEYVVGKTVAEVKAIETKVVNNHKIPVDEALLSAGCTMQITEFKDAVVKACEDAQGMSFTAKEGFTLGIAAKTAVDAKDTKAATAEANGVIAMYSDFAACVVADGKIIASLNDAIQPKIEVTTAGDIAKKTFVDTKRALKEGYNMAKFGANMDPNGDGKVNEWYLQSEAFSKYVVGKTADEVAALETAANSIGYQMSTDKALLDAGCTIQITAIKAVVAQSAKNAR